MSPAEREELFGQALSLPPEEREALVAEACRDDPESRDELLSLLGVADEARPFFDSLAQAVISASPWADDLVADIATRDAMVGQTLRQYRVEEILGRGGMGIVYRAYDTRLDRTVALKFLPAHLSTDEAAKDRFLVEARAAAALDHPNVCSVYEIGENEEGRLFIAMAHYEGETVAEKIARGPLEVEEATGLAMQAASGLAAAHTAGLIHRDIKPANLLVTKDGVLKILDFGLAKTADMDLTRPGLRLGTVAYMSPEQTRGEEVDARTDLWSLGVVLYEMLTGQRPFQGGADSIVIDAIRRGDPRPPSELGEGIRPEVEQLVLGLLAKTPEDRLEGAELLSEELAAAARPGVSTWGRLSIRTKVAVGTALGLLLTLAAIGGLNTVPRIISPSPPPLVLDTETLNRVVVLPFAYRGSDEHRYLAAGMVELLSETLDGAGDLSTVDPSDVLEIVGEQAANPREQAPVIADSLDAGRYVVGEIVEVGTRLRVSARLYRRDQGREAEMQATVEGSPDSTFLLIDDLTATLLVSNLEGPAHRLTRLAAVTTDSLEAFKAYLEGVHHVGGNLARDAFLRALAVDSTYALAWYQLVEAIEKGLLSLRGIEAAERAVALGHALESRDRMLLQARLARTRGAIDEAERLYNAILERYGDDYDAFRALCVMGDVYNHVRGRPRTALPCGYALQWAPDDLLLLQPGFFLALEAGDAETADSALAGMSRYVRGDPPRFMQAVRDIAVGDSVQRALVLSEDMNLQLGFITSFLASGLLHQLRDALHFARSGRRSALEQGVPSEDLAIAGVGLTIAMLEAALGRWDTAKAELSNLANRDWAFEYGTLWSLSHAPSLTTEQLRALRDSLLRWDAAAVVSIPTPNNIARAYLGMHNDVHVHLRHYLLGRISQRLGEEEAALRYAEELEQMEAPEVAGSLSLDLAQAIRAWVHWGRGDAVAALDALEAAPRQVLFEKLSGSPFFTEPQERFLRAEILASLGRYEEALDWYGSFWMPSIYDVIHLAPSHLRRAEIYERLGNPEEAREHYERFIALWADADPEIQPQVRSAQERLDRTARQD